MGVDVQCDRHIGVPHQILKTLQIHSGIGHVGAEGVAKYVRGDPGKGNHMNLVVLLPDPLHHMLDMEGNLGITVLIQQDKAGVAVDHRLLLGFRPVGEDVVQAPVDLVAHGQKAAAALGLGFLHIALAASGPHQLMIHPDAPLLKVQVCHGQSAELADPHACSQKHHDLIQVLAVMAVLGNEVQEVPLLPLGQCHPLLGVVGDDVQAEIKGISPNQLLRKRHLEGGLHHSTDAGNGIPGVAVIVNLDEPQLGIRHFDGADLPVAKVILGNHALHKLVSTPGGVPDSPLLHVDVAFQKLQHRDVGGGIADAVRLHSLDLGFLLPQLVQRGSVDAAAVVLGVGVAVIVSAVLALALAGPQHTTFVIFAFIRH